MRSRRCCRTDAASCSIAMADRRTARRSPSRPEDGPAQDADSGRQRRPVRRDRPPDLRGGWCAARRAVRSGPARVLGDPITVVEHVLMKPTGAADYTVSRMGTLVYVTGEATTADSVARVGRPEGTRGTNQGAAPAYFLPRISPDGTRVAIAIYDRGNTEIWIWDLARETLRRLTFSPGIDGLPFWTPDGRQNISCRIERAWGTFTVRPPTARDRRPADVKPEPAVADGNLAGREMARRL